MILTVNKESGELTVQETGCKMSITRPRLHNFMRFVWSNAKLDHETQDTEVWDVNPKILRLLEVGYHFHTVGVVRRLTEYAKQPAARNKGLETRADRIVLVHKILRAAAGGDINIEIKNSGSVRFSGPATSRTMTMTTPENTVTITSNVIFSMATDPGPSGVYFEKVYEMVKDAEKGHIEDGFHALTSFLNPVNAVINNTIVSPSTYYSLRYAFRKAGELKMPILGVAAIS